MKVFVTGATGFIGSRVVKELINSGHQVIGLTRSDEGAKSLAAAGAQVHRGDLEDLESLRTGAANSDGVIHTAFNHDFSDFSKFKASGEMEKNSIEALGSAIASSNRPFVVTSGIGLLGTDRLATEEDVAPADSAMVPRVPEQTAFPFVSRGVNVSVIRLPQVHDPVKQGLVTWMVAAARAKGVSVYVGDGLSRWAAAHVLDTARLYRLALEKHEAGATYHAVAEEGVPLRQIAETIGRGLNVPVVSQSLEEATAHFGLIATFVGKNLQGSSKLTQERLGWHPTGPGLIADLEQMQYVQAA